MRPYRRQAATLLLTINLETGKPLVHEALVHLERELDSARQQKLAILKLIHGYGSTGKGGDIRIAVQKRLRELHDQGAIRQCIFGEDWTTSDPQAWALLTRHPNLKTDADLGKRNPGITIVEL